MNDYLKEFRWMNIEFESRLKAKRKERKELAYHLEKLDLELKKMEETVDYVVMLALKYEFKERINELRALQDEDINKRSNCGEGLTGNKKKRLEKGIAINPIIQQDEWLMDELIDNQEWYKQQLEFITNKLIS